MSREDPRFSAEKLLELRRRRMLSQRELARRAGVTQPAVHYAETGRRTPSPSTVHALARGLGVELDALLDFELEAGQSSNGGG